MSLRPAIHLVTDAPEPRESPPLLSPETVSPTQAQRIAGERAADAGRAIGRITGAPFLTAHAREQAKALRIVLERTCSELRRAGL